jgi:hypothetical protein
MHFQRRRLEHQDVTAVFQGRHVGIERKVQGPDTYPGNPVSVVVQSPGVRSVFGTQSAAMEGHLHKSAENTSTAK